MKVVVPGNLDLKELLSKHEYVMIEGWKGKGRPYKSKLLLRHEDKMYWFISLVMRQQVKENKLQEYVPLMSEYLRKFIADDTRKKLVSALSHLGIVGFDRYYIRGAESQKYIVYPEHWLQGFKVHELGSEFRRKANRVFDKRTEDLLSDSNYPEYRFQRDCLLNINFDYQSAEIVSNNFLQEAINTFESTRSQFGDSSNRTKVAFKNLSDARNTHTYMEFKLAEITTGTPSINLNNNVDRFFSVVTNLSKILRPYILDSKGRSLFSIDFSCSHYHHLILTLKLKSWVRSIGKGLGGEAIRTQLFEELPKIDIYNHIQNEYWTRFKREISRDEAKDLWNQYFLCGKGLGSNTSKTIKSLFPELNKVIESMSPDGVKESHNLLSTLLQKSESKLLNNIIIRRIAHEAPDATIFGIFDALLVDKDHFDEVYNIMLEEGTKYFGYEAKLKHEELKREIV